MKRIFLLGMITIVLFPLLSFAEEEALQSYDYYLLKTQNMIDSRYFMEKDGALKMRAVSTNLNDDLRVSLYYRNNKNGNLGWLNFLLPSLGNWIVGDRFGAIVCDVGILCGAFFVNGPGSTLGNSSGNPNGAVRLIGLADMGFFYIFSVVRTFTYADEYNNNLMSGLGIASASSPGINYQMRYLALNSRKESFDLFYINLVSYRF